MHLHKQFISSLIVLLAVMASESKTLPSSLRVMTYNVRYDSMPDEIPVKETINALPKGLPQAPSKYYKDTFEKPWSTRRIYVTNDILCRDIDIYGGQELLKRQVLDLEELLGEGFGHIGVGREDGLEDGEYNPIFYKKDILRLQDWDTFWLTDTPFEPSKVRDAGSYRIATTARFIGPAGLFTMINTHLDDQSQKARSLGASLIFHRAKHEAIKTRRLVVLTGDFNVPSNDDAYQIITGRKEPEPINKEFSDKYSWTREEELEFQNFAFKDLLGEAPAQRRSGNYATFTDFAALNDTGNFQRLDYIFGSSGGRWSINSYHVGDNLHDDGTYASDHRPVDVEINIIENLALNQQ